MKGTLDTRGEKNEEGVLVISVFQNKIHTQFDLNNRFTFSQGLKAENKVWQVRFSYELSFWLTDSNLFIMSPNSKEGRMKEWKDFYVSSKNSIL